MPKPEEDKQPSAAEVLFPLGRPYKLDSGVNVEVKKWSVGQLTRFTQRVPQVVERFMDAPKDAAIVTLFPTMLDEVTEVVAESIGWESKRVQDEMTADDLLGVAILVWDHCLSGLLAKTQGLTARLGSLMAGPTPTPTTPPTGSSRPSASS